MSLSSTTYWMVPTNHKRVVLLRAIMSWFEKQRHLLTIRVEQQQLSTEVEKVS